MSGRFLAVAFWFVLIAIIPMPAEANEYPNETLPAAIGCEELSLPQARGRAATVLVCLSIDCPISSEYLPTLNRLAGAYRPLGVNFVGINPSGGQSLEQMAAYAREQNLAFPFVKDDGGKVSRRLLYSVTPEVRVFDAGGKLVYSGRIDDRYRRGGVSDKVVAKDLENALDEVLAGKPVSASQTKPIGCPIQITVPQAGKK